MFLRPIGAAHRIFFTRSSQHLFQHSLCVLPQMSSSLVDPIPEDEEKAAKRPKYDNRRASKNNRRNGDKDAAWGDSATFKDVHKGSYADPEQRQLFSIAWPPETNDLPEEKRSKKKVAILLGYVGTNYGGFQINPGVRSIQAELELALWKVGLLRQENFGYPHKYSWSTSGRTDKGVHAAAQTVSLRIEWPNDDTPATDETVADMQRQAAALLPLLNAALPEDIRVLDLVRTSRPFVAKTQRDRVRYRYMIPSFCLMEPAALQQLFQETITPPPTTATTGPLHKRTWPTDPSELQRFHRRVASYRLSLAQRENLHQTLRQYVGTHSFHNFTRRCRAGEPRAQRYILGFRVDDPVLLTAAAEDGAATTDDAATLEWIPTTVTGQSFLLNQIRKMIHCAVEVARGARPSTFLADYLQGPELLKPLYPAPAQGLFLDMSIYESYNTKVARLGHPTPRIDWFLRGTAAQERWRDFRDTVLVPHVAAEELAQGNFVQYMYRLEHPAYYQNDDDEEEEEGEEEEAEEKQDES
jgi:tRNA pseudouridine38-40 synthase